MTAEELIDRLARDAGPVKPLRPPVRRALLLLAAIAAAGAIAVALWGDASAMLARYAGNEGLMAIETAAMVATAMLAIAGAFALSVPGRDRRWLAAPLPPLLVWMGASGLGCWADLARFGPAAWSIGHGGDCFFFILGASLLVGAPLAWRLSRARPIDPFPVAMLGGLGAAALAALLLQFFHPFGLTAIDLAIHFGAVLIVVTLSTLLRRRTLSPA